MRKSNAERTEATHSLLTHSYPKSQILQDTNKYAGHDKELKIFNKILCNILPTNTYKAEKMQ
jgi:hypothetical protein